MEMFTIENNPAGSAVERDNILLVEDDLLNRELITIYLRKIGNIDNAPDGLTAIELTKRKSYSLILMDINLGAGINGIETAKRIRENDEYKNVPIIAITAFAMSGDKSKLLAEGFDQYLAKPFEKKELVDLIQSVLCVKC